MNKAMLASIVAEKLGISKREAGEIVDTVLNTIAETVAVGTKVSLAGFGSFEGVSKPARTARNPRTGETVEVEAKIAPKFTAAAAFKELVNS